MTDSTEAGGCAVIFIVFILVIIALASVIATFNDALRETRKEAIDRGHAEYVVDGYGYPEFQWKIKEDSQESLDTAPQE